jgi:DNA-binding cell septation regulator SpoVG
MKKIEIIEFEKNKFIFVGVFSQRILKGLFQDIFEPKSRKWRGEYQDIMQEIVAACKNHGIKLTGRTE